MSCPLTKFALCAALAFMSTWANAQTIEPTPPPTLSAAVSVTQSVSATAGTIESRPLEPLRELSNAVVTAPSAVQNVNAPADLWERIRRGYAMQDLDTALVKDREVWYAARPDYIGRISDRGRKYLFHIVDELERRNMPTELALLPFIESAFVTHAVSSAKAAGMWQFMPATGKAFDLKQNLFRDDRRDVLASTRAALDYLSKLHNMFGDWHLALAAYNWGEGSVGRALAKNKKAGLGQSYLDLKMPDETRLYIPKLQAVKNIVTDPARFNMRLPQVDNHPFFQTVAISRDIDVDLAARLAEVKLDDFVALNPSANKPVILAAGTPQILLPWDNAEVFNRNLAAHSGRLASWTAWTVPSKMRPADAAKRVGMTEQRLREVNRIPPRHSITAGSTLLVPRGQSVADVAPKVADMAQLSLAADARKVCRKVKGKQVCRMVAFNSKASAKSGATRAKSGAKSGAKASAKGKNAVVKAKRTGKASKKRR